MKVTSKGLSRAICVGCGFFLQFIVSVARFLAVSTQTSISHNDPVLHESELFGEYNHRTGRLDDGNDPHGWY